jgi:hypothetical protein
MSKMIPPDQIAANTLKMLNHNIRHYRNFGVYWYFVKSFLKRYYTKDTLYILGDYEQPEVVARMPKYDSFEDAMHDALLTAYQNQKHNMDNATSIGPDDEPVTLFDADAGL